MPTVFFHKASGNYYSLDMLYAWLNMYNPKGVKADISVFAHHLDEVETAQGRARASANTVLNAPNEWPDMMARINRADVNGPVVIFDGAILDGMAILAKAKMLGRATVNVIDMNKAAMNRLILFHKGDEPRPVEPWEYIQLFVERFPTPKSTKSTKPAQK